MGEVHERMVRKFREKLRDKGYSIISKTPIPDYRPDIYAVKYDNQDNISEEILVEVEIVDSVFYEHSEDQIIKMNSYLENKSKKVKSLGYLIVPKKAKVSAQVLTQSLFPQNCSVKVMVI